MGNKAYMLLDPETEKIYTGRDVVFEEDFFEQLYFN